MLPSASAAAHVVCPPIAHIAQCAKLLRCCAAADCPLSSAPAARSLWRMAGRIDFFCSRDLLKVAHCARDDIISRVALPIYVRALSWISLVYYYAREHCPTNLRCLICGWHIVAEGGNMISQLRQ